ncbi:MAG: hypothetical protein EOM87_07475 [Clostridia bacterium]|nr:hypothetical protein [Clostridia bacterium]
MNSIIDKIGKQYIEDYLENSKVIDYTELTEEQGLQKILYDDLPRTVINGYPVASDFVNGNGEIIDTAEYEKLSPIEQAQYKLRYYYLPYTHELFVGTTGSGKTTGCIEPQIRAISSQKNKPNLFITDPKGELFNKNARHLKDNGYVTYVLNFKDLVNSDHWNPLGEMYNYKMELASIGENIETVDSIKESNVKLMDKPEEYTGKYYICGEKAFASSASLIKYLEFQRDYLEAKISDLVNQFVNMMIKVQSQNDKSWEYGAQDLLKGIINCMLDDAADKKSGFKREMMNMKTIQEYYIALKLPIFADKYTLYCHPLLKNKSRHTIDLMATALGNAPNTMRSYCGVFDGAVKDWFQSHIFALTTGDTVDIDKIGDKPFAIFIITRDYDKSDFNVAGLFIDWVYRKMVERADKLMDNSKRPDDCNVRALHFILDEFANIPEIKDFENKIATSRSRNIWYHLALQSYKQLDHVYGSDRAVIIHDNCNSHVFLGAQNAETKGYFAGICGNRSVPALNSYFNADNNDISTVPVIPVSKLDRIAPGTMYIKRLYMSVIKSQFVRSYICSKYGIYKKANKGLEECTPTYIESWNAPKYRYSKLKQILESLSSGSNDID